MNPAKAAARINGKIQSYERGLGGPEFTHDEIVLAMSFISSEGAQLLGRVKYAGQDEYRGALINSLMLTLLAEGPRKGWIPPGGEELLKVCRLAVMEAVEPPLCPECRGAGWKFDRLPVAGRPAADAPAPKRVHCERCDGWGHLRPSLYWRWRRAGIGRKRFTNRWANHYDRVIMPILDRFESDFWSGLRNKLLPAALARYVVDSLIDKT